MFGIDEYLAKLGDFLPYLYSLLFFVSIGVSKRATSLAITVLVLAMAEFFMNGLRDPVLAFASDEQFNYEARLAVWYGCWVVGNVAIVFALQYTHVWLNVTREREASIIILVLMGYVVMHSIGFFNRVFVDIPAISLFYQIGIPTLNVGVAVFLLYSMLGTLFNVDFRFAVRRNNNN